MKDGEVYIMNAEQKRITVLIPSNIEAPLDSFKKEFFYDCTQSDMIRELVSAGIQAVKAEKAAKEQQRENTP